MHHDFWKNNSCTTWDNIKLVVNSGRSNSLPQNHLINSTRSLPGLIFQDYFSERMVGLRTDLRVLQKLLAEEAPELAEHLDLEGRKKGTSRRVECFTWGRSVGVVAFFGSKRHKMSEFQLRWITSHRSNCIARCEHNIRRTTRENKTKY